VLPKWYLTFLQQACLQIQACVSRVDLYLQDLLMTEPDLAAGFQHTQFLVMDEADRLLEASFEPDLRAILTKLPAKRQTLLFSATMTKNLVALQKAVLRDAYHFQVRLGSCVSPTSHHDLSQSRSAGCIKFCAQLTSCCCSLLLFHKYKTWQSPRVVSTPDVTVCGSRG